MDKQELFSHSFLVRKVRNPVSLKVKGDSAVLEKVGGFLFIYLKSYYVKLSVKGVHWMAL